MQTSTPELPNEIAAAAIKSAALLLAGGHGGHAGVVLRQLVKAADANPVIDRDHLKNGLVLLGLACHHGGRDGDGVAALTRAAREFPEDPDVHNNLALCRSGLGQHPAALAHLRRAIELRPDVADYYQNLAVTLRGLGRHDEAVELFETALRLDPTGNKILLGLGSTLGEMRRVDEAEKYFLRALANDPEFAPAHIDLAYCYHLQGRWAEAWPHYEWRLRLFPQMKAFVTVYGASRMWDGVAPLAGKRLLVWCEQGLGDAVMFSRYVPLLSARGAVVTLQCPPDGGPFFRRQTVPLGLSGVRTEATVTGSEFDLHCSVVSLPALLRLPKIPGPLFDPPPRPPAGELFRVGIVWAGSPRHPRDRDRSVNLDRFAGLKLVPGVRLVSLQQDHRPRAYHDDVEPRDLSAGLSDFGLEELNPGGPFPDSARLAECLMGIDLVIAVDTAVLHVAGSLGIPAWAVLPRECDWRWRHEGTETEWYPSVRLFRQDRQGDWDSVFAEVRRALNDLVLRGNRPPAG